MRFFLIGGKTCKSKGCCSLEEELLKKTNKECPRILFFANASKDVEDSLRRFEIDMFGLRCSISLYKKETDLQEELHTYDILFFGGGITQKLRFELSFYQELFATYRGIIAGCSAGANIWFKSGMGDFYSYQDNFHTYNYKMISGYSFINATFCPHYQKEDLVVYDDVVKDYDCDGFAVENDVAIWIENGSIEVFKQNLSSSVYWFKREDGYKMIALYPGMKYSMTE